MEIPEQTVTGPMALRYEDVAQDGRPRLVAIPVALGTIWRAVALPDEIRHGLLGHGILPILTRFTIDAFDGPFGIEAPVQVQGTFGLAHAKNAAGSVERLYLDIGAQLEAPLGRQNLPPPPGAGTSAAFGTIFAEHVLTKPFAPPGERKVLALPIGGHDVVPPRERAERSPRAPLFPAEDGRAVGTTELETDLPSRTMGLIHTDSNQHVNSLVYLTLFEEAAVHRLAKLGRSPHVLGRSVEISFRRPSFAGDALSVALRLVEHDDGIDAIGAFFGDGERELDKARAYVRMTFR
jgi:hypothetical protein